MFVQKKFSNWLSHFWRICILLDPKKCKIYRTYSNLLNDPKFFAYEYQKYAEFYADYKSDEIIRKKCTHEKLFAQTFGS